MTATAEVVIDSIAAGGDGVARAEGGLVVFVPRTAPGDIARVEVASAGRFARGRVVELVRESPDRVEPPCPHYVRDCCGGCQLQHIDYAAQLRAKSGIIRDAVERIGRRELPPPLVRPAPSPWRYRRKLTLALRRAGDRWVAGLHRFDDADAVFDLRDCPITDERVVAAWRTILAGGGAHLPPARALRASVRLLDDERVALVVEGGTRWPSAERFFAALPLLAGLWWKPEGGGMRRLGTRLEESQSAAAAFVQVNAAVAAALHDYVADRARTYAPRRVVDAYAGTGETAVPLAATGAEVVAIELDRAAVRACAARLPAGSRAIAGRVEELLPGALPADVVLLNPPRAGVDRRVTATLEQARPAPRAIVYVSCNPATLARDLARLPAFRIARLEAFDMFPQTAHVETVCELVPEAA